MLIAAVMCLSQGGAVFADEISASSVTVGEKTDGAATIEEKADDSEAAVSPSLNEEEDVVEAPDGKADGADAGAGETDGTEVSEDKADAPEDAAAAKDAKDAKEAEEDTEAEEDSEAEESAGGTEGITLTKVSAERTSITVSGDVIDESGLYVDLEIIDPEGTLKSEKTVSVNAYKSGVTFTGLTPNTHYTVSACAISDNSAKIPGVWKSTDIWTTFDIGDAISDYSGAYADEIEMTRVHVKGIAINDGYVVCATAVEKGTAVSLDGITTMAGIRWMTALIPMTRITSLPPERPHISSMGRRALLPNIQSCFSMKTADIWQIILSQGIPVQ